MVSIYGNLFGAPSLLPLEVPPTNNTASDNEGICSSSDNSKPRRRSEVVTASREELLRDFERAPDGSYYCHKCNVRYKHARGMETHVLYSLKHDPDNLKRWKTCEVCNKKFHPTSINKHMVEKHGIGERVRRKKRSEQSGSKQLKSNRGSGRAKSVCSDSSSRSDEWSSTKKSISKKKGKQSRKITESPAPVSTSTTTTASGMARKKRRSSSDSTTPFEMMEESFAFMTGETFGIGENLDQCPPSFHDAFPDPVGQGFDESFNMDFGQSPVHEETEDDLLLVRTAQDHILPHNIWSSDFSGCAPLFNPALAIDETQTPNIYMEEYMNMSLFNDHTPLMMPTVTTPIAVQENVMIQDESMNDDGEQSDIDIFFTF